MNYVAIKKINNNPVEFLYIDTNDLPLGFDEVWTRLDWEIYISNNNIQPTDVVFKITGLYSSPEDINYNLYGFHKKRTIVKGELILVEYYRNYNPQTQIYSDLILTESRTFGRDINTGLAYMRTQNISWYLTDETIGATKQTVKYYTLTESIDEGITRRKNVIAEAKIYTLGALGLGPAQAVLIQLATPIAAFIDGATQYLRDSINALPDATMSPVHKANLINILVLL